MFRLLVARHPSDTLIVRGAEALQRVQVKVQNPFGFPLRRLKPAPSRGEFELSALGPLQGQTASQGTEPGHWADRYVLLPVRALLGTLCPGRCRVEPDTLAREFAGCGFNRSRTPQILNFHEICRELAPSPPPPPPSPWLVF